MQKTKHIFIICLLLAAVISCKKEKAPEPVPVVNIAPPPPLTVTSIPENTGYQKIYNVKLYNNVYPSGQAPVTTLMRDFTYTCAVIGDTMLANNIPAKKYLHSFSHPDYSPIKSYSYLQNNMWYQEPLKYGDFVLRFSLPLPMAIGQKWGMIVPTNNDTLRVDTLLFENINNVNTQCFRIPGQEKSMTNFQTRNYRYYVGAKGIVKIDYEYLDVTNINQMVINNYIVTLISSNF
jgi:hypothetical protein